MDRIYSNRPDLGPPTKQPRLEEAERSKMVVVCGGQRQVPKPKEKGVITKEDLAKMKFKACAICGIADDHGQSRCPLRQACPSTKLVGPLAEIVCWCCEEDPAIAHPNKYVMGRARLKENVFDIIRIHPRPS
ncbi:hypothetical protein AQUCO_00300782v1 [Aquilegia coerulea]|uniref:Uncharacterized protein n=1 Tax=Aquilegia coerulea TaxID=218851 RepID=A0A2G5F0J3_AQUCA|nr:hypothetical protein AQUCO_00300782v1 [Aquilegia coerulea]